MILFKITKMKGQSLSATMLLKFSLLLTIIAASEGKFLSKLFSGMSNSNNGCYSGSMLQMPSKWSFSQMLCRPSGSLWSGGMTGGGWGGSGGWNSGYNTYPGYSGYGYGNSGYMSRLCGYNAAGSNAGYNTAGSYYGSGYGYPYSYTPSGWYNTQSTGYNSGYNSGSWSSRDQQQQLQATRKGREYQTNKNPIQQQPIPLSPSQYNKYNPSTTTSTSLSKTQHGNEIVQQQLTPY